MFFSRAVLSNVGRIVIGQPIVISPWPAKLAIFILLESDGSSPPVIDAVLRIAIPTFRMLLRHSVLRTARRADWTAGAISELNTAMIEITTRSSISVNPDRGRCLRLERDVIFRILE